MLPNPLSLLVTFTSTLLDLKLEISLSASLIAWKVSNYMIFPLHQHVWQRLLLLCHILCLSSYLTVSILSSIDMVIGATCCYFICFFVNKGSLHNAISGGCMIASEVKLETQVENCVMQFQKFHILVWLIPIPIRTGCQMCLECFALNKHCNCIFSEGLLCRPVFKLDPPNTLL